MVNPQIVGRTSSAPAANVCTRMGGDHETARVEGRHGRTVDSADPQPVLNALKDPDCREILREIADAPSTANECSRTYDIPLSTVYRKLDLMREAGLVDRNPRFLERGKRPDEYVPRVESEDISLGEDGSLTLSVRHEETPQES